MPSSLDLRRVIGRFAPYPRLPSMGGQALANRAQTRPLRPAVTLPETTVSSERAFRAGEIPPRGAEREWWVGTAR
jgi:hypothetical protein